ncbi:MAG: FlgO family outer membrane protein [Campylobacterota bacterium]|nr:FlgO family outer membrane protein [Campylobacterota bacterium]
MFIFRNIILLLSFSILFFGCSLPKSKYYMELSATNYDEIISELLKKSENQFFPHMKKNEILLVSNIAETVTLRSNTKLSFILTDNLKNQLVSKYSYIVREIETANQFRFGGEGFKVLTRDINKIDAITHNARYAVVGLYTITENQLLLSVKLISIKNGNILAASTYRTDLTQEILKANKIIVEKNKKPIIPNNSIYEPIVL